MFRSVAFGLVVQAIASFESDFGAFDDEALSLAQLRAHRKDTQSADGCDNSAGGYACSPGASGVGRAVQVLRDLGCRGAPDMWGCTVDSAKAACDADVECKSFGVSAAWGLNKAQLFGETGTNPNADWNLWIESDVPDVAEAVGDPHITTLTGHHFDLVESDLVAHKADGCANSAGGYACSPGMIGAGRAVQVLRDLGCGGAPDMWGCSVDNAKAACDANDACKSFGVSARWGLNRAQLFGGTDSNPNADWNLWIESEEVDVAAAVGDPHITTNSGKHFDLVTGN